MPYLATLFLVITVGVLTSCSLFQKAEPKVDKAYSYILDRAAEAEELIIVGKTSGWISEANAAKYMGDVNALRDTATSNKDYLLLTVIPQIREIVESLKALEASARAAK